MNKINDGGSAFPFGQISELTGQPVNGFFDPGMSLRDYFAAKALTAIIAANDPAVGSRAVECGSDVSCFMAAMAYKFADAMLAAREVQR